MPITFNCSCGERLEVDDELAGKQARCPYCEAVVTVPAAPPSLLVKRAKLAEPVETDDDHGAYAGSLNPDDWSNRRSSRRRRDDEDEQDRPSRRRRSSYDRDDDDDDRPRGRRFEPPPYNAFNKQTIGGLVAIVIGVVVFVVGLYFELVCLRLVIILVIAGMIGLIRGLVTGRDG